MCENLNVEIKKISDSLLQQIMKELGVNDRVPILAVAIDEGNGAIIVGTGEKQFENKLIGYPIKTITSATPACILTAQGSNVTSVSIGGTSITNIW